MMNKGKPAPKPAPKVSGEKSMPRPVNMDLRNRIAMKGKAMMIGAEGKNC
jgi:hypothetical protein